MEGIKEKRLVIIGASGHGKVIADIAEKNGYNDIVFLDDNENIKQCAGYPIVGRTMELNRCLNNDIAIAIGKADVRKKFQEKINEDCLPVLIHPYSSIGKNVEFGAGTIIMAGAVINSDTKIGKGCIINTSSSVDHDCRIGDYVHVAVGSHIAGNVRIGDNTWIGAGATVINNVMICEDCVIGAGAVVVKEITAPGVYVGIPARKRSDAGLELNRNVCRVAKIPGGGGIENRIYIHKVNSLVVIGRAS